MKTKSLLLLCSFLCCMPCFLSAQINKEIASPLNLFNEGKELFRLENFAAAAPLLQAFTECGVPDERLRMETAYMLACVAYELKDGRAVEVFDRYLEEYPDSPYANRIYALTGSAYFFEEKHPEALAMFHSSNLELLGNEERDDMTYRMAVSYMTTGNTNQAAIWFETLRRISPKYRKDASYYIAYINYTKERYDEALSEFLPLRNDPKYKSLAPYYIADIYLRKEQYNEAIAVARDYRSTYPDSRYGAEMHRILGESYYNLDEYHNAVPNLEAYLAGESSPKRGALYALGISYYRTGVFSKSAETLDRVTTADDALTQNAYLHIGLSCLELADKNRARMAFEQAAASNADMAVKEQAAYNCALTIHDTSFSAFGESVTVFEGFLNDFPNSPYREKISAYLVDVYLNTRSYEAALTSIERIARPGTRIMEAKQKILFRLGTLAFANASFPETVGYLDRSIAIGQYDRQVNADAHYWRGEAYYRMERPADAARNFTEYLNLNRQTNTEMYALAHYNLGYTAFQQKDYAGARQWFVKYVQLAGKDNRTTLADAYNRIGDSYFRTRNFEDAKHYYSLAEGMETPSGDYSFYQLALVSGLQKDYAGKITILNRLIGKYPDSPYVVNAIYEKGRSYVLMENNNQAIASFNELLAKYPNSQLSRKASAEIGLLHYRNEDYDQAIAAYKRVVQNYPGSEEARLALRDLKSIYIDLNRVNEFAALASSLPGEIRFDANEQDSLTYIAAEKVYTRGRIEEAKESFNRYLMEYPEGGFNLNAHYYLTLIYNAQKNPDKVLYHSGKLLEYPHNLFSEEALVIRGETQFNLRQYKDALATYRQLAGSASTAERRILAKTGVLRSAYLLKDNTEAILAASDLLSESRLSPELKNEAAYYRAKSYLNEKDGKQALADLRELAKDTRNPYGAEAKYLVAQVLYEEKNYTGAEKELLDFIDQSTPHAYWLARGFILLSDVYVAMERPSEARQYLLSLQQNYKADDNIKDMIENRLRKLNE